MWAREFGAQSGVAIPNQAAEHYYLITEAIKDLPQNMPVLEDPSAYGYYRQEGGGLMVGLFEPVCAPWKIEGSPTDIALRRPAARLGTHGAVPRDGHGARADHRARSA